MPIKNYFGRIVAIDASMSIYQFLIAIRSEGLMLTNEAGETTSHLNGFFYRTIRMVENGIKPIYVFDGKPPALKSSELKKRAQKRKEAVEGHEEAKETGEQEEIEKFSRRTVRVTAEHNEEVRKLLTLMGIPYIVAPCEAEATCAALVKAGKAYAAGTEDMDTITHGTPILLRHLTFAEARKQPILEIHLDEVLKGLEMDMPQFIDLCILLGCDYADSIKGVGPHRALSLIKQHGSIEKVLEHLDKAKYNIADDWPYKEARKLFSHAEVADVSSIDLKWNAADEEGLVNFMVKEKGFNEERIRSGAKKLIRNKNTAVQGRLDGFFKKVAKPAEEAGASNKKRKTDTDSNQKPTKKGKGK